MSGLAGAALVLALGVLALPARAGPAARVQALLPGSECVPRDGRLARLRQRPGRREAADPLAVAANWDLLAACLHAGLPVAEALRAVAGGLPGEAGGSVQRTADLLALGAGAEEAWRPVAECSQTAPLAAAARRSARSGSALAGAAAELAARMRAEQSDAAEARAQRAGVLITGPLGFCFLPGFLCLGVIPVVIGLAGQLTVFR